MSPVRSSPPVQVSKFIGRAAPNPGQGVPPPVIPFPTAATTGPAAGGYTSLTPVNLGGGVIVNSTGLPSWVTHELDGSYLIQACAFTGTGGIVFNVGNVRILGCSMVLSGGAGDALAFNNDGVTISYCLISADTSAPAERLDTTIQGNAVNNVTITYTNVFWCRQQAGFGGNNITLTANYWHDLVEQAGDHSENVYFGGGNLAINVTGNTMLNPLDQTAAIFMDNSSGGLYDGVTISQNLLAGGGYTIYGGVAKGGSVQNEVITNNAFSTIYDPNVGGFGPVTDTGIGTPGYEWSGNYYYDGPDQGQPVPD
jgi:hypothetical protein